MNMPKIARHKLKNKLEYHYRAFNKSVSAPDPVEYPHKFSDSTDIEIAAFIASVFAYGTIAQIKFSLNKIFNITGDKPAEFVMDYKFQHGKKEFANIRHRFYKPNDIASLFLILNTVYKNYGSLKNLFLLYYLEEEQNLKNALSNFSNNLKYIAHREQLYSNGIKFMFPDPQKGSACKRMNLFLRWMVRKDKIDFGLWKEIRKNQLIIPVDTHIAKISRQLKLTKRKIISWKMAEDITNELKLINPADPVKYDFSLCHIGIRKQKF